MWGNWHATAHIQRPGKVSSFAIASYAHERHQRIRDENLNSVPHDHSQYAHKTPRTAQDVVRHVFRIRSAPGVEQPRPGSRAPTRPTRRPLRGRGFRRRNAPAALRELGSLGRPSVLRLRRRRARNPKPVSARGHRGVAARKGENGGCGPSSGRLCGDQKQGSPSPVQCSSDRARHASKYYAYTKYG